ncbi:MAG: rod shape-determining protein MreC [Hyphomicrobiaceae bacterium]
MRLIRHDSFARGREVAHTRVFRHGFSFMLVLVSIALLLLSRLQHGQIAEIRLQLAELMAPALKAAIVPLEPLRRVGQRIETYFELHGELERLRAENQRLRGWEWRAQETERKASQLARLANVVEEPGIEFLTARVVANSSGPFVRSAMLGIGRDRGMKTGYPVIDANGLVGRLIETGARASRVLLVTDINSRIPVQVGRQATRAVLLGDNGPQPRLGYLPAEATIEAGDEVYTSGIGGLLPRGLRIGSVVEDVDGFRMRPHARLDELDYVSILLFESPTIEFADDDKPSKPNDGLQRRSALGRSGRNTEMP